MALLRGRRRGQRLVTIGWLVDEDQVLGVVERFREAGFSVTVSPNVHAQVVDPATIHHLTPRQAPRFPENEEGPGVCRSGPFANSLDQATRKACGHGTNPQ